MIASKDRDALGQLRMRLGALRLFIDEERREPVPLPWLTRLRAWSHGFTTASAARYGLGRRSTSDYLTDYCMFRAASIGDPYTELIAKLVFQPVMGRVLPIPRYLALIVEGRVCPLDRAPEGDAVDELLRCAEEYGRVVLKPSAGPGGGRGVQVLDVEDGCIYVGGRLVTKPQLAALVGGLDGYLVQEFVQQAAYARELYPGVINTVRIVTMVDPHTQEPFIPAAVHRIGTQHSAPVDNCARGGLSAIIDLDTGTLGRATWPLTHGKLTWHERHPETGSPIAGVQVANWALVKEGMLRAVRQMPYLRYVGWDVVVTDDGFRVVEGNNTPGMDIIQVHAPLLAEPRVREFYKYHRVI